MDYILLTREQGLKHLCKDQICVIMAMYNIVVKGTIDLLAAPVNENDKVEKDVAFKN